MTSAKSGPTAAAQLGLDIKLLNKGKGPTIAGFKTQVYSLQVNGKNCGTIFGSKKLLNKKGIKEIFSALSQLQNQTQNMMGAYRGMMGECEQAELQMSNSYNTTGAPMRLLDQQGQLESEVRKINDNAKTPASYYKIPATYRVTNMQEKMNQARQQNERTRQQMQDNMPDMNKLMQQMQQQQGMPPEALERMKKMQDMFKQQSQQ